MDSIAAGSGSIGEDITLRCQSVAVIARPLRRKVFQTDLIKSVAKLNVLQTLLISRNTYHVGCWPVLNKSEYGKFKTAIIRLYKLLLLKEDTIDPGSVLEWPIDEEACVRVQPQHPAVLVRYLRLCTAVRLMVRAPTRF